ncbi:Ubiquitin thioesterase otubain-like [Zea mays]|uniref:Ubiquitin thioesterase otubain-like n=1 Tax=Zea mays TaxID=4577 RepID=A0A1D6KKH5_MAIZE|nr:Ubiquitin thioesterase otubain-like [Zea mays]
MGAGLDPSPSFGGCSDPVLVELSMGGDYYRACCGEPDSDIPEGPKLPCVGDKEPLSSSAAEFQSGSPILQEKIKEHILERQDKAEVDHIMVKIEECKKEDTPVSWIY